MAKISETVFRKYVDGQDRITAQEYMREREVLRLAVNDVEDKYEIVKDMQLEFSDINSEINQNRRDTEVALAQVIDKTEEIQAAVGQAKEEISVASVQAIEEARLMANEAKKAAKEIIAELAPYTGDWDDGDWDDGSYYENADIDGGEW